MRSPNEIAGIPPEADLRTIVIRRRPDAAARAADTKLAPTRPDLPDGLFFAKGVASADAFRPPYWSYGDAPANDVLEPAPARAKASPAGAAPADRELSQAERTFLEFHHRALTQGPPPETEGDATRQAEPSLTPGQPDDSAAPAADLRSVLLRRSGRDAARIDELFLHKGQAAAAEPERGSGERREPSSASAPAPADPRPGADAPESDADGAAAFLAEAAPGDERALARTGAFVRPGRGRATPLTTLQIAIIGFGCIAVLASAGVFFPINFPPPRAELAVQPLPPPPVAAPAAAPAANPQSAAIDDFIARGDERLRSGDVAAARLFYGKAADAGSSHGALMMGATFDPKFLAAIGVYGLPGDEKAALVWYGRAGDLGDPEAAKLAKNLRPQ